MGGVECGLDGQSRGDQRDVTVAEMLQPYGGTGRGLCQQDAVVRRRLDQQVRQERRQSREVGPDAEIHGVLHVGLELLAMTGRRASFTLVDFDQCRPDRWNRGRGTGFRGSVGSPGSPRRSATVTCRALALAMRVERRSTLFRPASIWLTYDWVTPASPASTAWLMPLRRMRQYLIRAPIVLAAAAIARSRSQIDGGWLAGLRR